MSDNVPFEIHTEIMKRLPIKSLIQIRSVCKTWKSVIDSADFINNYSGQLQHLLLRYKDRVDLHEKYVLIADDDTFPHHQLILTIPPSVNMLSNSRIFGSSHGLLCLYGHCQDGTARALLWNPSIRKVVTVDVPNVADGVLYQTVLGFGVCPKTNDPKIVKITHINMWGHRERVTCIPCQVEVFTLTTRAWRSHRSGSFPRKSLEFRDSHVVADGVFYWLANDMDGGMETCNLIVSFDMTSEEFREVHLPDSLTYKSIRDLSIDKLRESVVVVERDVETVDVFFRVWIMDDVVQKSFTKLLTIIIPDKVFEVYVAGFRKTGEPLLYSLACYPEWTGSLAVYEPYSKSITSLGINGEDFFYVGNCYIGTLLLL